MDPDLSVFVFKDGDPIGIAVDHDVWIVCSHNELSLALDLVNLADNQVIHHGIVKIILWLVNDQWLIAKIEQEGEYG
ncbi:MAG: hypothetical protein K6A65_05585 [Succinivibrionaceae bacterium]|nr:hypothetical protein [Succinivibrionaceae bacterium]